MSIEVVSSPKYFVYGSQLERTLFTDKNPSMWQEYPRYHEAVAWARASGGVLQSAREDIIFRLHDSNPSPDCQIALTRTAAIFFRYEGKWLVAIDDIPDPEKNILLAHSKKFTSYEDEAVWTLPISDELISDALDRANEDNRIVPSRAYYFDVDKPGDLKRFARNRLVQAVMGDVTPEYAAALPEIVTEGFASTKIDGKRGMEVIAVLPSSRGVRIPKDHVIVSSVIVEPGLLGPLHGALVNEGYARGVKYI